MIAIINEEKGELRINYHKKDGRIIIYSVNNILGEYLHPDYYKSIKKIIEDKYECKKA